MRSKYYTHLNEQMLLEMAEIGRFDGYKIMIYGNEGPIPHFHVEHKEKNLSVCVRIDKAEYFSHGSHKDKLDSKVIKKLKLFLESPHKFFGKNGYTNWQIICVYWNDNNMDYQIEDVNSLKMPDYSKIS